MSKNKPIKENIENKKIPTFLIVSFLILVATILLIYFLFLYYSPETIIMQEAYAIPDKMINQNLRATEESKIQKEVQLLKIEEQSTIFRKLSSYFIEGNTNRQIDITCPIYLKDSVAILNIYKDIKLITTNFEEVEGYPEFTIADGKMFNTVDFNRADSNEYLFMKNEDNIFTNVKEIYLKTPINTYVIPINSIIYFTKDRITYYEKQEKENLTYHKINDIDMQSEIKINDGTYTYEEFLKKMNIIQERKNNVQNEKQETEENTANEENATKKKETVEDKGEEVPEKTLNEIDTEQNNENTQSTNQGQDIQNNGQNSNIPYVKPEVTSKLIDTQAYTTKFEIGISDPSGRITEPLQLTIKSENKVVRRLQILSDGVLEIAGLKPDTQYNISGTYTYMDENQNLITTEFCNENIQTKGIETLGTIHLKYENGAIYSNKIELQKLKFDNDIKEEVVKGVAKIELIVGNIRYKFRNSQILELIQGKEISYQTGETVKSNQSNIMYEFKLYDKYGNELKVENNKGKTKTCKQAPVINLIMKKQDITEVIIGISIRNVDNVKLENYHYIITNSKKEIVAQENLKQTEEELTLTNLNPNDYFTIQIYADYDIGDGKGKLTNQLMNEAKFVTLPISSLGYLHINAQKTEVTQDKIKIKLNVNKNKTDVRLLQILNKLEIKIKSEKDEKQIQLNDEQWQKLLQYEEIEIEGTGLKSNTKYEIEFLAKAKQGNVEEKIEVSCELKEVTTLKKQEEVLIKNLFVTENIIDFDLMIQDIDKTILNEKVRVELRDQNKELVDIKEIQVNSEYNRITYEKLQKNTTYEILFYATEYNISNENDTYEANHLLKNLQIYTEENITGNLELLNIKRVSQGKNLVDMSSEVNWYVNGLFNTWPTSYSKNYDPENEVLNLDSTNSWTNCVYDLREYIGKTVTFSFKARLEEGTSEVYIQNSKERWNNIQRIQDLTTEWKEYQYTLTVDETGYLGFLYQPDGPRLQFREIQVELGNRKTDYEKFSYKLQAETQINLTDVKDAIETNDYYIRIYKNDELQNEYRYEEIGNDNVIKNAIKKYDVYNNSNYRIELLVNVKDRYYVIDTQTFEIYSNEEVKGISSKQEYLEIQPNGSYIVLNDIDFRDITNEYQYRFGNTGLPFNGKINFNGHRVLINAKSQGGIFYETSENAIIENMVLDIYLDNTVEISPYRALMVNNGGIIRNIQLNLKQCNNLGNTQIYFITQENRGTIENFVVNLETTLYCANEVATIAGSNYGIIKNGYAFGKTITARYSIPSDQTLILGALVKENKNNATIKNVYSLININTINQEGIEQEIANIVASNSENASIQNMYSVGTGNTQNLSIGPTAGYSNNNRYENVYYFADAIFQNDINLKGSNVALHDTTFQNLILNSNDNAFNVDELLKQGYYPHLNMPDAMPRQQYNKLPEIEEKDLADIISSEVIEQNSKEVKVKINVYNPSGETIQEIKINQIDTEILEQKYENERSEVIALLKNPKTYVSEYNVQSITTKGAMNLPYTRTYEDGERIIYVDFYREIYTVQDWKEIRNSPTENYQLMNDLDFVNEQESIYLNFEYMGKLNGNGKTIRNINLVNTQGLIKQLSGQIQNLFIENLKMEGRTQSLPMGLVGETIGKVTIDNVHLKDIEIIGRTKTQYMGGIIGRNKDATTIKNSSVTNINIKNNTEANNTLIIAGALVGVAGESINIYNSYAQEIEIEIKNAIESQVGGIIGLTEKYSTIENCYTTGNINTNVKNVGGIIGASSLITEISQCYSKVNIINSDDYVGGIQGGETVSSPTTLKNNIYLGDIYVSIDSENVNRIKGYTTQDTSANNYAYKDQLINGEISNQKLGAILLTKEQLLRKDTYANTLNFGTNYDYTGIEKGILPKLKSADGTYILPNQADNYLVIEDNISIESVKHQKRDAQTVIINIILNNPNEYEITEIEIEDMESEINRNVWQNGKNSIEILATPKRYYDSYRISNIKYKVGEEQREKEVSYRILETFYKELYTYEDWQMIEENTYQNYKLMDDIDFSGKTYVKSNIGIGRLESSGHTLKNIEITFNESGNGLISEVKNELKNINFEGITLNSTSECALIVGNNGIIENVNFKDITINSPGAAYVGVISRGKQGAANNINLQNITINGRRNVGGFIAFNSSMYLNNITANNITINATGEYIGGIVGYGESEKQYENIRVEKSYIKGDSYVGGIFGHGRGDNLYSIENIVIGNTYVGGIAGGLWYANSVTTCSDLYVYDCEINGNGDKIGGITGRTSWIGSGKRFEVLNTKITVDNVNASQIGGAFGDVGSEIPSYGRVENNIIETTGSDVGGIVGRISEIGCENQYCNNNTITGGSRVGGIVGSMDSGTISNTYGENKVIALNDTAGGVLGYLNNSEMTGSQKVSSIKNNAVNGSIITAPEKAGGLIGDVAKNLYTQVDYYLKNFIEAYVNSNNIVQVSLGIGGNKEQNKSLKYTGVYKYSTINGEVVNENNDTFAKEQLYTESDLEKRETYVNKLKWDSTWDYTPLGAGKYPILNTSLIEQEAIQLPIDPTGTQSLSTETNPSTMIEEKDEEQQLPSIKAYTVSADKINIDFSDITDNTYITIKVGEKTEEFKLENKTYTLQYNFKNVIEIILTNGTKKETTTIDPIQLKRNITINGDNYAYLEGNTLYINNQEFQGDFVNVYDNKALKEDGSLYNIETKTIEEKINEPIAKLDKIQPLEEYEYQGRKIQGFATYSKIDENIKSQIYTVKNGRLSILSIHLDMKVGQKIIDSYNNKDYQTILGNDGIMYDLKESINYPEEFKNQNIQEIQVNSDNTKTNVMIYYQDGSVVIFDYITGEIVFEKINETKIGLMEYILQSFDIKEKLYNDTTEEYEKGEELAEMLEEEPVDSLITEKGNTENITQDKEKAENTANKNLTQNISTNTQSQYITTYNPISKQYEVYKEDEILNSEQEEPESENTKIIKNGLTNHYQSAYKSTNNIKQSSKLIIFITIICIILTALVVLRKKLVKNKNK